MISFPRFLLICLISLQFLFNFSFVRSDDDNSDPDVVVLAEKNFESFIHQDIVLVEFYAPWCGHCKTLKPEYAKAATELKKNDPPVPLGKVDATVENSLAGKYGVNGYPTLKVFRNGKPFDYDGPRQADGIVKYMLIRTGPAIRPLATEKDLKSFLKIDKTLNYGIAGFFDDGKVSQLHAAFQLVANKLRDEYNFGRFTIGNSSDAEKILQKHTNSTSEAIVAFSHNKPIVYDSSSGTKTSQVENFVISNALPLVSFFSDDLQSLYSKRSPNVPLLKVFMKPASTDLNSKAMKYVVNRLKKLAGKYDPLTKLVTVIVDKEKYKSAADQYHVQSDEHFALVIEHLKDGNFKKYKYVAATDEEAKSKTMNVDSWSKWVEDVLDGKVSEYVKSERPPADNNGPVKIVTGQTFDQIVNDPSKDVLIEFYAPWCGHCRALEPKYNQLGEKVAKKNKSGNVIIAKIDATNNDFDRHTWSVSGYPTIYFRKASKNGKLSTPIKYEGGRDTEELYSFVKKHSLHLSKKNKNKKQKKVKEKISHEEL